MHRKRQSHLTILIATIMLAGAGATAAPPTSAQSQTIENARAALRVGHFAEATKLLEPLVPDASQPVTDEPARLLEIMRRIRMDYPLTPAEMLTKLRRFIPDVTQAEMEEWTQAGALQHRIIDGETRYFAREPSNLWRFSPSANRRWVASQDGDVRQPDTWRFPLADHVAKLVEAATQQQRADVHPLHCRVTYTLRVPADHPRVRKGARARCWLPYPQEYGPQRGVELIASAPPDAQVAPPGVPQRTVYLEQTVARNGQPLEFKATYEFRTHAICPQLDPAKARPIDPDDPALRPHLAARPPHVPLDDEVKSLARKIVGHEKNPLRRAQRVFRWVCENVRYCAEMEYSTIESLGKKALASRRGDCGVQAMAFITLCRAAGVPARWQSGWTTLPQDWNMHDWAEFYVPPWGWLPADPSYGLLDHPDPRVREFYCGHLDEYRMIVNVDYGRPFLPPKTSFRSEPNDFQRGEIEIDGHNLYFDEWDWEFEFETKRLNRTK